MKAGQTAEEEHFSPDAGNGERLLMRRWLTRRMAVLSGKVVFRLYDTYGFPLELTAEIAGGAWPQRQSRTSFDEEMRQQRNVPVLPAGMRSPWEASPWI